MKTKLLTFAILLISFCIFSTATFGQVAPGNDGTGGLPPDGGGTIPGVGPTTCPISYSFKRNNGNGWGVCHGDAQIRVTFDPMPSAAEVPLLTGIFYLGVRLTNVILPVSGDLVTKGQGYVSYCLIGSAPEKNNGNPFANIPPAVKLLLEFTYPNGLICTTDYVN